MHVACFPLGPRVSWLWGPDDIRADSPLIPTQISPCVSLNMIFTPGSLSILLLLHRSSLPPLPPVCTC